jgi:hypothetical protein
MHACTSLLIELNITGTIPPTGNVKPCPGMPTVVIPSLSTQRKNAVSLNFQKPGQNALKHRSRRRKMHLPVHCFTIKTSFKTLE